MSFYEIGTKFPSGHLITADGRELLTATGDNIVTEATRERIESMWDGDFDIMGESTMDITPPLRKVSITVKNKGLDNLISVLGFYDLKKWNDPYEFLSLTDATTLKFLGDGAHQNHVIETCGYEVQKCTYKLTLEYAIRAQHAKYSLSGSYRPSGDNEYIVKFYYGVKIVGASATYWLQDDGQWVGSEGFMMEEAKTSTETNKKIEIDGIPANGRLVFYMKQTLKYDVRGNSGGGRVYGEWEAVSFYNMRLTIDTGDDYENSLRYEVMVNHANNADLSIQLPIADIPNIPNDRLIYSLYFTDASGQPTRMWHTRGGNDYNTLLGHFVGCALRYKQLPGRRITGEMFSGRHIDMNTVVQDSKFLRCGFYVNSIELKAVEDSYDTELVEMPGLVRSETPPQGDDCILGARLSFTVRMALLCGGIIILLSADNRIYTYDPASRSVRQLLSYTREVSIHPADNSFAVVDGAGVSIVDYRGVVIKRHDREDYDTPATYMGGYIYLLQAQLQHVAVRRFVVDAVKAIHIDVDLPERRARFDHALGIQIHPVRDVEIQLQQVEAHLQQRPQTPPACDVRSVEIHEGDARKQVEPVNGLDRHLIRRCGEALRVEVGNDVAAPIERPVAHDRHAEAARIGGEQADVLEVFGTEDIDRSFRCLDRHEEFAAAALPCYFEGLATLEPHLFGRAGIVPLGDLHPPERTLELALQFRIIP